MAEIINRMIQLRRRPLGLPSEEDFELVELPLPQPGRGEFLVRNIWLSVDPYMRGRMRETEGYIPPYQLGQPLEGGCIGRVVASNHSDYAPGEYVSAMQGWREYYISQGLHLSKVNPQVAPLRTYLGALGMPGMTAYVGLLRIGGLKRGDNVFVSGAAGAVGSVACQIAKIKGCRVVGTAGSSAKVEWLTNDLALDGAFNYKTVDSMDEQIAKLFPNGIDLYFDNVGGNMLEKALGQMATHGRVVLCGMISQYNLDKPPPGPSTINMAIPRRLRLEGFLVLDHTDMLEGFQTDMGHWIAQNKISWKETIVHGIENMPRAFAGLFKGENIGKMLVKVGPDEGE